MSINTTTTINARITAQVDGETHYGTIRITIGANGCGPTSTHTAGSIHVDLVTSTVFGGGFDATNPMICAKRRTEDTGLADVLLGRHAAEPTLDPRVDRTRARSCAGGFSLAPDEMHALAKAIDSIAYQIDEANRAATRGDAARSPR